MERTIQTKFYLFDQNNSGGHFDVDANVCARVIIEALNEDHAIALFEPMIENQSPSCHRCGVRWYVSGTELNAEALATEPYKVSVSSYDRKAEDLWFSKYGHYKRLEEPKWIQRYTIMYFEGAICFESIEQYLQFVADGRHYTTPDARIHYLDGTKKRNNYKQGLTFA